MNRTHHIAVAVTASATLLLSACGGGSDSASADTTAVDTTSSTEQTSSAEPTDSSEQTSSGDVSDFCERVRVLDSMDDTGDLAVSLEAFEQLVDAAPDEIRSDIEIVVGALSELVDVDEDDPQSFEQVFEVFQRPEVVAAGDNLERYGVEVCGLAPTPTDDVDLSDFDDPDENVDGDGVTAGDDRYDEEFWGPIDPNEISIPGLKQHLDLNYPDSGWFETANGWTIGGTSDIRVTGTYDPSDGVALCEALLEYAAPLEPDVTLTVSDDTDSTAFATGTADGGCVAAS